MKSNKSKRTPARRSRGKKNRKPAPPRNIWRNRFKTMRPAEADRLIVACVRGVGREMMRRGDAFGTTQNILGKKAKAVEPALLAVINSREVVRAIGRPELEANDDAPAWLELSKSNAGLTLLKIHYKGAALPGQKIAREFNPVSGRIDRVEKTTGVERDFSYEALGEAMAAAKTALRSAGCVLAPFSETRRLNAGGVATIAIRSLSANRTPRLTLVR